VETVSNRPGFRHILKIGSGDSGPVEDGEKQLLHLVFGGELKNLASTQFRDLDALDIVGIFPDYRSAEAAWRAKAQASVDNAHMRYFVVHLHRLLDPDPTLSGSQ
jgi:hypothetical protein